MPTDPHVAELRSRAEELRRLAAHLDGTPLATVLERAGPDTWVSPHAGELREQLGFDRRRLAEAVDDLRRHAHHLERQAAALEVASVLTGS
jgi:hypothetical protein